MAEQVTRKAASECQPELSPYECARQRLIVALDFSAADSALSFADRLKDQCQWFKIGLELFIASGPAIVERLVERGHSVFLDLKLHDIPNTVASAVRSAGSLGASMLTIHASGGPVMLAAAREAAAKLPSPPQLLAVTVLTSMDEPQLAATGIPRSPVEQVRLLAQTGLDSGINGFVCSPQEAAALRALAGPSATLVTPGIRPSGSEVGDQKRIATPTSALADGASYLVVGRPITQAAQPELAAEAILLEIAEALAIAPTE
ncbi:orotidine-5'-phosphate decarboxylase [Acidicapsa dinghuensis]|uniref:Orotidine 5'-phosphate decarboxylase n=1 Tax=Acidicapsa dinghuensis TaxID=2218256 RepID=A0ABW1EMN8_9BACT|nr:orotidine-5'-phosphate decarboxylase [Acidicapsa dinghuensis]